MTNKPEGAADLIEVTERVDAWTNALTKLGIAGADPTLDTLFGRRGDLGDEERWALYEEDSLFARIIDVVPEHATRRWISITGQNSDGGIDDDFGRGVLDDLDELQAQDRFYEAMRLDRLDGGSAILIGADDGQDPSKPLNLDRIRKIDYLNVLTRFDIFPGPKVIDPRSPDFRQPEYYSFTPGSSLMTAKGDGLVHPSRVIRFSGINASERTLHNRNGWGVSIAPRIYDSVRRWGTIYSYVESIFQCIVQGVYTLENLVELLAADDGRQKVFTRLQNMQRMKSSFNAIVLDKTEQFEQRTLSLTGFSDLVLRCMDHLSSVSEIPLTILFGQPPSGLSTDDESARTNFYDAISNKQRKLLREPLRRVIEVVIANKSGTTKGKTPEKWDFQFLSLEEPTEKEDSDRRMVDANIDDKYHSMGVLMAEEIRARLANDPKSPYMIEADMPPELEEAAANALAATRPQDPSQPGDQQDQQNSAGAQDAARVLAETDESGIENRGDSIERMDAKAAVIGEVRDRANGQFVKTAPGQWVKVKKGKDGKWEAAIKKTDHASHEKVAKAQGKAADAKAPQTFAQKIQAHKMAEHSAKTQQLSDKLAAAKAKTAAMKAKLEATKANVADLKTKIADVKKQTAQVKTSQAKVNTLKAKKSPFTTPELSKAEHVKQQKIAHESAAHINKLSTGKTKFATAVINKPKDQKEWDTVHAVTLFTNGNVATVRDPSNHNGSAGVVSGVFIKGQRDGKPTLAPGHKSDYEKAHSIVMALAAREASDLPPIHRGMMLSDKAAKLIKAGGTFDFSAVSSWTKDKSVTDDFATSKAHGVTPVVFTIKNPKRGTDITGVSHFAHESEILSSGKTRITSVKVEKDGRISVEAEHI